MAGTVRIAILANGAKARQELESVGKSGSRLGQALKTGLAVGAGVAGAAIVKTFTDGVKAAEDYLTLQRKTAAVIKSTGNAARISVKGVKSLAGNLESLSGIDENLIINAQNVLATFTDVRNGVKKTDRIFDKATATIVDMSAALGTDLQGSAIQVGKALNDPIKGISALSRVGVTFTQGQKDQIKALVEAGDKMGAQKLILAELNKEFGGAAKAAGGEGFTGAMNRAKDAAGDLVRDLVTGALPTLTRLADGFTTKVLPAISDFAAGVRDKVLPKIRDAFTTLSSFVPKIDLSAALKGLVAQVKGFGKPIVDAFTVGVKTGDYGPLGTALGNALGQAIRGSAGLAAKIFGAVGDFAASVDWLQLGKKVGGQALPFVIGFVNALFDPLFSGDFWRKNWTEVLLFAVAFIPFGKAGSIASRVAGKLGLEKGITGGIIKGLEGTLGALGGAVIDFARKATTTFVGGLLRGFGIDEAIAQLGRRIVLRFATIGFDAGEAGAGIVARFATRFFGGVEAAGALIGRGVLALLKFVTAPFRAAFGLLQEPITFIFRVWADEFRLGVGRAVGWGRSIVGGLGRGLGSTIRNLVTPIRQGVQLIAEQVGRLPGRLYTLGSSAVGRLGAALRTAGARFKGLLFEAGQNVMSSFLSGLSSFYNNNVKPFLNSITKRLPFEKGPPAKDRKLLTPAGKLVMGGFLTGLEAGYGDVQRSLTRFTTTLPALGSAGAAQAGQLAAPVLTATPGSSAPAALTIGFDPSSATAAADPLARALIDAFREIVRVRYGGDVRRALSQPGR